MRRLDSSFVRLDTSLFYSTTFSSRIYLSFLERNLLPSLKQIRIYYCIVLYFQIPLSLSRTILVRSSDQILAYSTSLRSFYSTSFSPKKFILRKFKIRFAAIITVSDASEKRFLFSIGPTEYGFILLDANKCPYLRVLHLVFSIRNM